MPISLMAQSVTMVGMRMMHSSSVGVTCKIVLGYSLTISVSINKVRSRYLTYS